MGDVPFFALLCLAFLSGYHTLTLSGGPRHNGALYVCAGDSFSLPWTVTLDNGDVIENIQWFYSGRSDEMVAILSHGQFVPLPAFAGRVQQTGNAGMTLGSVKVMDSGNYSTEVTVRAASGQLVILRGAAYVYVTDGLQTADGSLTAQQQQAVEYDNVNDQFHVVLRCGTFTYHTQPNFEATWTTPSGTTVASSGYENGDFHLLLPNPVEGGVYTCHLPDHGVCVNGDPPTAAVQVDKVEARLALMEARQMRMDTTLQAQLNSLKSDNHVLLFELNNLKTQNSQLQANVTALAGTTCSNCGNDIGISFHAQLTSPVHFNQDHYPHTHNSLSSQAYAVILPTVISNLGGGYDATSGIFTAPRSGMYYFAASTSSGDGSQQRLALMMDQHELEYVVTQDQDSVPAGTMHVVVHLDKHQHVWLREVGSSRHMMGISAFSGFLISSDP